MTADVVGATFGLENLTYSAYLVTFAILLALVEIEIEGKDGWAVNLPTWRRYTVLSVLVFGGRPTTGYHMFMNSIIVLNSIFVSLLFGAVFDPLASISPVMFAARWTLTGLTAFLVLGIFWDYWWFVLNPDFGWRGHNRHQVPWHPRWYGKWLNLDHLLGVCVLFSLSLMGHFIAGERYRRWVQCQFVVFVCGTHSFLQVSSLPVCLFVRCQMSSSFERADLHLFPLYRCSDLCVGAVCAVVSRAATQPRPRRTALLRRRHSFHLCGTRGGRSGGRGRSRTGARHAPPGAGAGAGSGCTRRRGTAPQLWL
jgi:hypothetical protein